MEFNLATKIFGISLFVILTIIVILFFIGCIIENHLPAGQLISNTESLKFMYDLYYAFGALEILSLIGLCVSLISDEI